jgi:hypothetical protein
MTTTDLVALATAEEARALTDRIKVAVEGTWHLITEAAMRGAHLALGYATWDDYVTREFGSSRLRLPREDRPEVLGSMRDAGMSVRAIASATNLARNTVRKELREVGQIDPPATPEPIAADIDVIEPYDDEPALTEEECEALDRENDLDGPELSDAELARQAEEIERRVTGTDGKSYPIPTPAAPKAPARKAITDSFWQAAYDLGKKVQTLTNLAADDRFKKNADQIRDKNLPDLIRARDALQCVIDQLT